jgi:hypothetical protein
MTRLKSVLIAFGAVLVVFIITHALKFPGSLAYLMQATGGQKILDMQPSFSSAETYQRLDAMGEFGRRMYLRTVLTIDLVFPIAVFVFLTIWGRFAAERARLQPRLERAFRLLPATYLAMDFVENAVVLALLWRYPERLVVLGGIIGYFTRTKRLAMMLALFLPPALLLRAYKPALLRPDRGVSGIMPG